MPTKHPRTLLRFVLAGVLIALITAATAGATTFTNSASITINDNGAATPYPSMMTVSGLSGTISDVNVTISGLTHPFTHDVAILVVGIGGAVKVLLMADCGQTATNLTLTFDDAGSVPNCGSSLSTGTITPGAIGLPGSCPYPNPLPGPAPLGPYSTSLSAFNGTNANGVWYLYVYDDCTSSTGSIANGWSLDITMAPTAVTMAGMSARTTRQGVLLRWRTASEADLLGFQVYRSRGQAWRRITHSLVVAKGTVAGARYRFVDRAAKAGSSVRYRIKAVHKDGTATWFGPVHAS